jgi:tetratricopeptide (TPR) repeat protein
MASPASTFELVLTGTDDPRRFTAWVPDGDGGRAAEQTFEWRVDSTALAMTLGSLKRAAVSGEPPEGDLHVTFGRRLFDTVFSGAVGALWTARLAEARPLRQAVRLVLRVDPKTARPLLNLPWEYLHDGHDFLALHWRTPISRLPWGLPSVSLPPLTEPLRLLVLIAAPLGLSQNMILNTAREEDLILEATAAAHRDRRLQVEFAPAGSPEALEAALREWDPHLLHFTGHGVFDEEKDTGYLLMETAAGRENQVSNTAFAEILERRGKSLRLVFLSACQSAVAPRGEGYADLAPRLLEAGIPAVVAMQFSVLNRSAMDFGSVFYKGLADRDPIDAALTEARGKLHAEGLNRVDFAVPVLFLADPACLEVDPVAFRPSDRLETPLDLTGVTVAQRFVGRSAELRLLQTNLDPDHGPWRAAILHGLGGMGKTVLAARLAERMAPRLDGVKSLRMSPVTSARDVLDQLTGFLQVNQLRLGHPRISDLVRIKDEPLPLEAKAAALCEVLRGLKLLVIFDNCEDVLPYGRTVSRARQTQEEAEAETAEEPSSDPALLTLFRLLLEGVPGPSRFLFTSRVDFDPLEAGRLSNAVGHLDLSELGFRDAVYLMETLPPLDALPVAVISNVTAQPDAEPPIEALSKRDLYERLGGHPYTLNLFAEHARRSSPAEVLADLSGVRKELLEVTLLDRAAAALPESAALLLRRAAVYEEAVPLEGLAFLLGDERDAMPPVEDELAALLGWGLLARPPGTDAYAVHALVRDWARSLWTEEERVGWLRRAAEYWLSLGRESTSLELALNARYYLFLAGNYERAGGIVQMAFKYLFRWGQIELVLRLLNESIGTLKGDSRAIALCNRATLYQGLGDYATARRDYEAVLKQFEQSGRKSHVAVALHELGVLHQLQGEYPEARTRYERSLAINKELGDKAGIARNLGQLGILYQLQGEYPEARTRYEQSLTIDQELGDKAGIAINLYQLGNVHFLLGEYPEARTRYEQSLAIAQELGDKVGIARSLHQLGILHQNQGEYPEARARYEQSLAILQELGNKAEIARSLHQLGMLHQYQEEYPEARARYEQSLAIAQELGDKAGIARSLHQLGILHQYQEEYPEARARYEQSLAILQELGDKAGIAGSLHQLSILAKVEGNYNDAVWYASHAFAMLDQLGSPERDVAGRTLAHLRETMDEDAFEEALELALDTIIEDDEEESLTGDQLLQLAMGNTVAVMTSFPEKRDEWWAALKNLQTRAESEGKGSTAAFFKVLRKLVNGARPADLASGIPPEFREPWETVLRGIRGE